MGQTPSVTVLPTHEMALWEHLLTARHRGTEAQRNNWLQELGLSHDDRVRPGWEDVSTDHIGVSPGSQVRIWRRRAREGLPVT